MGEEPFATQDHFAVESLVGAENILFQFGVDGSVFAGKFLLIVAGNIMVLLFHRTFLGKCKKWLGGNFIISVRATLGTILNLSK